MMYITLVVRQYLANHLAKLMLYHLVTLHLHKGNFGHFRSISTVSVFYANVHSTLRSQSIKYMYIWILDKIYSAFYSVIQRLSVELGTV